MSLFVGRQSVDDIVSLSGMPHVQACRCVVHGSVVYDVTCHNWKV